MQRQFSPWWIACLLVGIGDVPPYLAAQSSARLREPLPLDVAVSLRGHNSRSPINLSPDGEWITHHHLLQFGLIAPVDASGI